MKLRTKVIALAASHVAVVLIAAASFAGYLTQQAFRTAAQDPLHRLGVTMATQRTEKDASLSLDADLSSLFKTVRAPTAEVIRLVALLKQNRIEEAATACSTLGWPRCDTEALGNMREALDR